MAFAKIEIGRFGENMGKIDGLERSQEWQSDGNRRKRVANTRVYLTAPAAACLLRARAPDYFTFLLPPPHACLRYCPSTCPCLQ